MRISKEAFNTFLLAFFYGVFFYIMMQFLHKRDMIFILPDSKNLMYWDSAWYHDLAKNGYLYWTKGTSNSGFYFLFPLIWKLAGLNLYAIIVLNMAFMAAGFAIFTSLYKLSLAEKFLWLTIPSMYFCFIPYSEALFILVISVLFYGIVKKKVAIIWISLLLASILRPVSQVLFLAMLITELLTSPRNEWLKAIGRFFKLYGLPILIGNIIFTLVQWYQIGIWFAFYKAEKHWGHEFAWPTLPFNSTYGPKLLWLNAIALFTGFIALCLLVGYGFKWLVKNVAQNDKLLVLSLLYMTGVSLITILFSPIWGIWTTNIYDLHRYLFVNPFFWVFLHRYTVNRTYKLKDYLLFLLLANVFWLTFEHYQHIRYVLYFNSSTLFMILYMMNTNKKLGWVPLAITAINFFVQVQMFQWFLAMIYPG